MCPASLIKQWEAEVKNRCKRGLLNVLVFHGNKRAVDDRKLAKFNIVVTTYQTLVREAELESGMYKVKIAGYSDNYIHCCSIQCIIL